MKKIKKIVSDHKKIFKIVILLLSITLICCSYFLVKTIYTRNKERRLQHKRTSKIEMVKIPETQIEMSKYEVTQDLYDFVMGKNPSYFSENNEEYRIITGKKFSAYGNELPYNLPVENVSWYDAVYFCNKLSQLYNLTPAYNFSADFNIEVQKGKVTLNPTANGYRLPTVEEWVNAASGGENENYDLNVNIESVAWYKKNADFQAHQVGIRAANKYGLYDMLGNVWEWCWNTYVGNYHYNCGGSFDEDSETCKVNLQRSCSADFKNKNLGFRVVKTAKN